MGNCSSNDPAPFLQQWMDTIEDALMKALKSEQDPGDRIQAAMIKAAPLLSKSFDHHDTKKNGVLDAHEAAVFFQNLMTKLEGWLKRMMDRAVLPTLEAQVTSQIGEAVAQFPAKQQRQMEEKVKDIMRKVVSSFKEEFEGILKTYRAEKKQRDAAAFKVLDVNGDGKLQKKEFLEAFSFGEEKNTLFLLALGFNPEKMAEGIQAKIMQAMPEIMGEVMTVAMQAQMEAGGF